MPESGGAVAEPSAKDLQPWQVADVREPLWAAWRPFAAVLGLNGGSHGTIPAEWSGAFASIRTDPKPPRLTRNSHYLVSDETRHDLFRTDILDKGGVFMGVGPDQNYLMAGWARPRVLVLLDFDQVVVDLHAVYRVAFLEASSPGEFLELWAPGNEKSMERLLAREFGGHPRYNHIRKAHRMARTLVSVRLNRVRHSMKRLQVPCYLEDPEQYGFVRGLFVTGRVFAVRGDLTAASSVRDVGEAARKSGLRIGVLYLSNAEQYFPWEKQYRDNMLALPLDEHSVVLRTASIHTNRGKDGRYEYITQSGANFRAWMSDSRIHQVQRMIRHRSEGTLLGHSRIRALPPVSR